MSDLKLSYELNRSSGKKSSLSKGNEMLNQNDRLYHMTKAEIASHLRTIALETDFSEFDEIPTFTPESPCYILVVVHPPTNRRMDSPNWYPTVKPLIDGLTDAGIFSDDNDDVITSVTFIPSGTKTSNKKYKIDLHIRAGKLPVKGV